jgi:Lsr2
MARKVEVRLIDDLDSSPADESITFGLDGTDYEIDLSSKHAKELRGALERYISAAKRVGRGRGPSGVRAGRRTSRADREQNQAIRDWAQRKGLEIAPRGRIAQSVLEQYQAEAARGAGGGRRRRV